MSEEVACGVEETAFWGLRDCFVVRPSDFGCKVAVNPSKSDAVGFGLGLC